MIKKLSISLLKKDRVFENLYQNTYWKKMLEVAKFGDTFPELTQKVFGFAMIPFESQSIIQDNTIFIIKNFLIYALSFKEGQVTQDRFSCDSKSELNTILDKLSANSYTLMNLIDYSHKRKTL